MKTPIYGFKLVLGSPESKLTSFKDPKYTWEVGKIHSIHGELNLCNWGLHYSLTAEDAWECGVEIANTVSHWDRTISMMLIEAWDENLASDHGLCVLNILPMKLCTTKLTPMAVMQLSFTLGSKPFQRTPFYLIEQDLCKLANFMPTNLTRYCWVERQLQEF